MLIKRLFTIFLTANLTGCANFSYYTQAVSGQMNVWRSARPISALIADPDTNPKLRSILARVVTLREFASRDLKLPRNESYTYYADLQRPFAVWNVFAAPELSVTLKKWCFIQAGCVSYRGYFSQEEAKRYADKLAKQGHDVYVGGVRAYSTLGWFDDPVLNTFIDFSETELARLIFHELAHQAVYVPGDSVFNESFATTVEYEGVKRWFRRYGAAKDQAAFNAEQEINTLFMELVLEYRKRLHVMFNSEISDSEKRAAKKRIFIELQDAFQQLKGTYPKLSRYDQWFAQPPNNARLATVSIYTQLLPAFQALLRREHGDMKRFFQAIKKIGNLPAVARSAALQAALETTARSDSPE